MIDPQTAPTSQSPLPQTTGAGNPNPEFTNNQPITTHPSQNWFMIGGVIALFLIAFGGGILANQYYLSKQRTPVSLSENQNLGEQNTLTDITGELAASPQLPTQTASPVATPIAVEPDAIPQANSFYLSTQKGQAAIFVTNASLMEYYENGVKQTKNTIGLLRRADGTADQPFDYTQLESPRKILSLDPAEQLKILGSFMFNEARDTVYIALVLGDQTDQLSNLQKIYMVHPNTLESKQIWTHQIGDETYPKKGGASIEQVKSNYMILSLGACYACDGGTPFGKILLNTETGQEKYLGEVDNISFDLPNNRLTYQKVAPFEEACEPGIGCSNEGTQTVYKPTGEVITESLF